MKTRDLLIISWLVGWFAGDLLADLLEWWRGRRATDAPEATEWLPNPRYRILYDPRNRLATVEGTGFTQLAMPREHADALARVMTVPLIDCQPGTTIPLPATDAPQATEGG